MFKLWIDDVRPAPEGYIWLRSVNEAKKFLMEIENALDEYDYFPESLCIEVIDMDHDAGEFATDGGDYIQLLNWMERDDMGGWPIHIHSMNPVGVQNMRESLREIVGRKCNNENYKA